MKIRSILLSAAAAALLAAPLFAASPQKPGQWQVTMEMDMPNMPMKMPPMTQTVCVTQADVDNPDRAVPKERNNCKVSDYKVDGNTVTWSVKCEGKRPMSGTGAITFTGDTYSGSMQMKMGSDDATMTMKYSGKRLGDCSK